MFLIGIQKLVSEFDDDEHEKIGDDVDLEDGWIKNRTLPFGKRNLVRRKVVKPQGKEDEDNSRTVKKYVDAINGGNVIMS